MRNFWMRPVGLLATTALLGVLGGCASDANHVDPWEKTNRVTYQLNDGLDKYALKPAADTYVKVIPKPVRTGLGNGFDNLGYFNVIANDFLQAKWNQGWSDSGRMAINSSLGIAGIFDVAGPWGLSSHENDFGLTLGQWGCQTGPYLVLPLFGPSTVRDGAGIPVEFATDPTTYLCLPMRYVIPLYSVEAIDTRSRAEKEIRFRNAAAIDQYVFTRDAYMQYRQAQLHNQTPTTGPSIYDEESNEPATAPATAATTQPATAPSVGKAHD